MIVNYFFVVTLSWSVIVLLLRCTMFHRVPRLGGRIMFCVQRLGPFSKNMSCIRGNFFAVLRSSTFWRLRPSPNSYIVMHLSVLASTILSQNLGVWCPGFTTNKILEMKNSRISISMVEYLHPMHLQNPTPWLWSWIFPSHFWFQCHDKMIKF